MTTPASSTAPRSARPRPGLGRRATIVAAAAMLVIATLGWLGRDLPARWLCPEDDFAHVDAVLVFSGDVDYRRAEYAAGLVLAGRADWLIVTGAGVGGDSGTRLADRAIAAGVEPAQVLVETASTSTYENVLNALPLVRAHGFRSLALVTSPCHQRRAALVARHLLGGEGVELRNAPTPTPTTCRTAAGWYRDPETRRALASEYGKILVYALRGWL